MDENEKKEILHSYDGIEEQNNPMPGWWVALFIGCCIFASLYWLHYTFGGGSTLQQAYVENFQAYELSLKKNLPVDENDTEESLTQMMKSEIAIHEGREIFATKCAMCHGENLEGKVGPNLTDDFWTTGDGSRLAVIRTIKKGSAAKGMPPWEGTLKPLQIKQVAAFIFSKIGSHPPGAKGPEGTQVKK